MSVLARPTDREALAAWRQRLRQVRLPAASDEAVWKRLLEGAEDPTAVQPLLEQDLPLALAVLVEALRSPRFAADPGGLHHALRLLGGRALQGLLRRWANGRIDPARAEQRPLLQALADSRFACLIQLRWMRHGLVADAELRLWITALLGVARWKVALADPELVHRIEQRVAAGERRSQVERALLGFGMDELNALHLQDLGFPEMRAWAARLRLEPRHLARATRFAEDEARPRPLPPDLARTLRDPLRGCALAYGLALETRADWHAPRVVSLVRAAAVCLNRPALGVLEDLQRAALRASGEPLYTRGLVAPAARMILLPRPRRRERPAAAPAPPPRPAPTASPPGAAPPRAAPADRPTPPPAAAAPRAAPTSARSAAPAPAVRPGEDFLGRCRAHAFASLTELLEGMAGHLAGRALPRCLMALYRPQSQRLGILFTHGFADPCRLAQPGTRLPASSPLLQPPAAPIPEASLFVQPAQVAAARQRLPVLLAERVPDCGLVLASFASNDRPAGFWWADPGPEARASVDPRQLDAVREATAAFGAAFTRLLRARRDSLSGAAGGRAQSGPGASP
ncbi:MAG: hypothetical protein KatS3mg126_1799 [Lysobacteraceae bacterium]|nr:MAG: hypothetical protein KatS3mg126_1799 [Xanthomonadaceae bacterium]